MQNKFSILQSSRLNFSFLLELFKILPFFFYAISYSNLLNMRTPILCPGAVCDISEDTHLASWCDVFESGECRTARWLQDCAGMRPMVNRYRIMFLSACNRKTVKY